MVTASLAVALRTPMCARYRGQTRTFRPAGDEPQDVSLVGDNPADAAACQSSCRAAAAEAGEPIGQASDQWFCDLSNFAVRNPNHSVQICRGLTDRLCTAPIVRGLLSQLIQISATGVASRHSTDGFCSLTDGFKTAENL